jgi:hypothetical protein
MQQTMLGKHLFEYAVIRVVPRVEREEFINVGVVVFCAKLKFLDILYLVDEKKLSIFCSRIDPEEILANLKSIEKICAGGSGGGPIGLLDLPSRFRWLTATRSTVVQPSKVHPGFCENPSATLEKLFQQLVC